MNEQWKELFSLFGWSKGGFAPDTAEFFSDLEQMMQQRTQEMALEGQAAEAFAVYRQHQGEQLDFVALQNFKAGIFFALWLTGSTFFHMY